MAYELRRPIFDLSGSLAAAVASTDAQITGRGSLFTSLPTDYSTERYLPLVLANDGLGKSEIVWVTGHASASPTLTVVRGREGTTPTSFDAGDVVRCAATVRDLVLPVATRAELPVDAHYGCRALILDKGQVVERTSGGWNDSAAHEADPARRHHWTLAGASLTGGSLVTVAGWNSAGNHTGTLVTRPNSSTFVLNEPGHWVLKLAMYGASGSNRNQGVKIVWPDGALLHDPFQISGVFGGSGAAGNGLCESTWDGYVTADQAKKPLSAQVYSTINLTGCQYDLTAEYLGA